MRYLVLWSLLENYNAVVYLNSANQHANEQTPAEMQRVSEPDKEECNILVSVE